MIPEEPKAVSPEAKDRRILVKPFTRLNKIVPEHHRILRHPDNLPPQRQNITITIKEHIKNGKIIKTHTKLINRTSKPECNCDCKNEPNCDCVSKTT